MADTDLAMRKLIWFPPNVRILKRAIIALLIVIPLLIAYRVIVEVNVEACGPCLPAGLSLETQFCETENLTEKITVRQKLIQIGAFHIYGVIYDRWGTEVQFVIFQHHPPFLRGEKWEQKFDDSQKALWEEVGQLQKSYRVIKMWSPNLPV